jgi:antitoxin (DNA-binding transcriptional repressor) of toxin-antitoxin stability system
MRVGLREANQRFSSLVRAVKAGEEVVLTDRGRPVAVMRKLPEPTRGEVGIWRPRAAGLLRPAARSTPMPPWTPRRLRGAPLSRTIRAERDLS